MIAAQPPSPAPSPADGADVSRETDQLPAPPDEARAMFGDHLEAMTVFAELLAGDGVLRGIIGPREVPRLWQRHLLNCGAVAELIPPGVAVDDVGSGAGLPGIVLALARPDLGITLVEPLLRRTVFLEEAVSQLGLRNVAVVRARAEERAAAHAEVDVVTARAVAPLDRLVGWCLPLLKPGGVLLALKGSSAGDELAAAREAIRLAGGQDGEIVTVGHELIDPPTTVIRVRRATTGAVRGKRAGHGRSRR